jgi:hypothetical protein
MKYRSLVRVMLLWSFALPAQLLAQENEAQPDESKLPTEQHKRLNVLAGQWDVAIKFKVGPGKFQDGKATCESKWILGGKTLRQEYQSSMNGTPYTVLQLVGYDSNKKKFFEIKLDNMDTGAMFNEGTISDDGKEITQVGPYVDRKTGKNEKLRTVTKIIDKDHYTLEWYMPDENGNEEKAVTLSHTRKKI